MATPILMPRPGQSVESCLLVEWTVKPGQEVSEGEIVARIETDKAVFDVEAPAAGTVLELFFEEGADVPVLTPIAAVGAPGEDVGQLRPAPEPADAVLPDAGVAQENDERVGEQSVVVPGPAVSGTPSSFAASPRARKHARQAGVEIETLTGSGPGGRVIARDVRAAVDVVPADSREGITVIPVKGVRKIIAERMRSSLATTAQLTLNRSFDASALLARRKQAKEQVARAGQAAPTLNDLLVHTVVQTLARHPALNAHFLGDRIEQYLHVNMGIAVDTPRGLMVPVVRDAGQMTLYRLTQEIRDLAQACREGGLSPERLSGGTFTVTNLGTFGVESFTPVLNTPEVAILGIGGLYLKPVRGPDGIDVVEAMNLSLTMDHQAVDGATGARFLQDLSAALESL